MTSPLYYEDAYLKEFHAMVLEVQEGKLIILNKTGFYPAGGGQPSDVGMLIHNGETFIVNHVGKKEGKIVHEVEKQGLEVGSEVKGEINWNRRYKIMRMHTAAHTIAAIMHQQASALITGNQLDEEISRIDFALEQFNREQIEHYIEQANQYIKKNLPVKSYFITKEEAREIPEISRLAAFNIDKIAANNQIRIVEIQGFDKQADGGTHVKSLKEIGKVILDRLENKGSKNRRLYFKLDDL